MNVGVEEDVGKHDDTSFVEDSCFP
jgi:hypothetical protein